MSFDTKKYFPAGERPHATNRPGQIQNVDLLFESIYNKNGRRSSCRLQSWCLPYCSHTTSTLKFRRNRNGRRNWSEQSSWDCHRRVHRSLSIQNPQDHHQRSRRVKTSLLWLSPGHYVQGEFHRICEVFVFPLQIGQNSVTLLLSGWWNFSMEEVCLQTKLKSFSQ